MKKIYLNTRITELLGWLIVLAGILFALAICIRDLVEGTNPTIKYLYFVFPVIIIGALLIIAIFCIGVLRFVIIDGQKIISRNAFYKVSEVKWEQVKSIKINSVPSKSTSYEIVFLSETVPAGDMENEEIEDEDYITLRYSFKREQFLKALKPNIKFET